MGLKKMHVDICPSQSLTSETWTWEVASTGLPSSAHLLHHRHSCLYDWLVSGSLPRAASFFLQK